jgi:N-acetylmuramoyl-L-alanine amidase
MLSREARMRFFFFINSFGLLLLCLFVTPTNATAPQSTLAAPVLPVKVGKSEKAAEPETKPNIPASNVKRENVQVSRDERRKVRRNGHVKVSERDMELLARLVYAEGRGEPYEGQVAIAAVVLNRVASPQFPNTVREVIFAPNAFSPVQDGNLSRKSNESTRKAVRDAVNGKDPTNGSLYFFNPKTATSNWIWSRKQTVVIGNHRFAR